MYDERTRAGMTDEALSLITRWCNGEAVTFGGSHYSADGAQFASGPTQTPRVPVWIGRSSRPALRRAARWDGWVIGTIDETQRVVLPPSDVACRLAYLRDQGPRDGFEVAVMGAALVPGRVRYPRPAGRIRLVAYGARLESVLG